MKPTYAELVAMRDMYRDIAKLNLETIVDQQRAYNKHVRKLERLLASLSKRNRR